MAKRKNSKEQRLNKIIAMAGIASRRNADELIRRGLVTVNGKIARRLGVKAMWGADSIKVEGRLLPDPPQKIYLMLNKPFGYVSTLHDPEGRPIVRTLIKDVRERIFPVGRLDFDSQGLLIMTNDGELAFRLTHPRFRIPRTYKLIVEGILSDDSVARLQKGVVLQDGPTIPARVSIINKKQGRSFVRVTIFEGRSRELRRMFEAVEYRILKLTRIGYGSLTLGDLKVGKYRQLAGVEIKSLCTSVGLV